MKRTDALKRLRTLYTLRGLGMEYADPVVTPPQEAGHLPQGMEALRDAAMNCHLCALAKTRRHVVFGEGNESADVMFVGEGPGATEDETGRPFVGRAGELLTAMIEKGIGIPRSSVYIANIVKCRPPGNRTPSEEEAHTCRPFVMRQIELVRPKIIVALGATAFRYLTDTEIRITRARGQQFQLGEATLIPTFHPSYLLRNPSAKKEAYADCLTVKDLLG